jgi:hypothetical protein
MPDDPTWLVELVRSLLVKGGALQSTAGGEPIDDRALKAGVERQLGAAPAEVAVRAATSEVVANVQSALDKVAGGRSARLLTDREFASLEAIVQILGRPAMRYNAGRVGMPPTDLGDNDRWRVLVAIARSDINRASAAVGRVALSRPGSPGDHVGTAWRLGDDLVVTNRHVAKKLIEDPEAAIASWRLDPAKPSFVDFAVTDGVAVPERFSVAELAYCAPEKLMDFAVLRLDAGGRALPGALPLDDSAASLGREVSPGEFKGEEVYVVGHPYRVRATEETRAVFGDADGLKRCSPGVVLRIDPHEPLLEHDCSTLGGSSGSCVLTVEGHAVVGLHFAGRNVDTATEMGSANVALALSRLGDHRAGRILRKGRVTE